MSEPEEKPPAPFKITTLHAYISEDQNGEEGIIAQLLGDTFMPFVMADEQRMISLRPLAEKIALMGKTEGVKVKLVRFSMREDLETL